MIRLVGLVLITLLVLFICCGCYTQTDSNNTSHSIPSSTANESLYWIEVQERFYTNDLARAQAAIPFPIVLPVYVPDHREHATLPLINGPIPALSNGNNIDVYISYNLYLGSDTTGMIMIEERNKPIIPEDPKLNPDYEYIEIIDKVLIKTEGNFAPGPGSIFYFSHNNIYFVVEVYNLTTEEAAKVVESMIKQVE